MLSLPHQADPRKTNRKQKVQGEAQGDEASIDLFLKALDQGPRTAHVVKLDKEEMDVREGESGFEVRD
jgi:acylphosphatase